MQRENSLLSSCIAIQTCNSKVAAFFDQFNAQLVHTTKSRPLPAQSRCINQLRETKQDSRVDSLHKLRANYLRLSCVRIAQSLISESNSST